jgi:hypothetical protein
LVFSTNTHKNVPYPHPRLYRYTLINP